MTAPAWPPGEGEMACLTRGADWSATPLGPMEAWPGPLRSAVEIMLASRYPMLIWWGPDLVQLYNDAYIPVMGARHPWGLGQPAPTIWSDAWPTVGPLAATVMQNGISTWNERLQISMTRNGHPEEVYMTFSYSPIRGEDGGIAGLFCACMEETGRVLAERRVRTLRDLADAAAEARGAAEACATACALLDGNPHDLPFALLYLLDAEGRTAVLAGAAGIPEGTPGCPRRIDLAGGTPPPRSPPRSPPWPLDEVAHTGRRVTVSDLGAHFGPLLRVWPEPVERAVVLPLARPGGGRPAGMLVAGISPRLVLDEGYHDFLGLLAGGIGTAVANARAYEEERRRAEALAEIDRAQTRFLSNISHEFRTPLTLILGPLEEMLARPALAAEDRQQIAVAHRNGERLLRLVNTLLDLSRVEAGRAQAAYQATDLAALTADLASSFRSACDGAGLHLTVDCPPLPEPVFLDRGMWEKVVLNLLSNAFNFTFAGGIAVRVRAGADRADGADGADGAELEVRDTGTGIPASDLGRVFERFHRVDGSRGRTHEGSGIGLALVQDLVRLHGGTVTAGSVAGAGTAFTVRIPFGHAHLPDGQAAAAAPSAAAPSAAAPRAEAFMGQALRWMPDAADPAHLAPADPHRPRVLIADDNADMRDHVRRILAARYAVEAVADGMAALAAAERQRPDLLLADVMMPGLDGFGLLRAVRASPALADLPVVLLSARAGEEARAEGLEAGASDYLVKPFAARELMLRVGASLDMARLRRDAFEATHEAERARERSHAASVLRASEDRYHALFATSPVPFLVLAPNPPHFTIIAVNEAYLGTTLTTRDGLIGLGVFDVFTDDPARSGTPGWELLAISLDRVMATRQPDAMTRTRYDIVTPDGRFEPHWWLAINAPLLDASGQVSAIIHQVTRETERHLAEDTERKYREKQAFLLRLSDALRPLGDAEDVKKTATRLLGEHLGVNRAFYGEVEGDDWIIVGNYEHGIVPLTPGRFQAGVYGDWIMQTYRRGGILEFSDSGADPRISASERVALGHFQITAALGVGLVKGDRLGAIFGVHSATRRMWTAEEIELVQETAERTWAALERALAEASLRQSEERFRALARAGRYSLYRMSPDWRLMHHLDSQDLAITSEPIEGWADKYIFAEDLPLVDAAIAQAIRTRSPFELEHRVLHADGSIGWIESRAVPLFGPDGAVTEWFGAGSDVTPRRWAEDRLRENEAKYRNLFNSIDEGFCIIEMVFDGAGKAVDYIFLETNPAFLKQTGWPDVVGRRMRDIAPAHEEFWFQTYGRIAGTGQPERFEHQIASIGKRFSVFAFRVDEPGRHRIAVLFDDIEWRKQAEEALRASEERFRAFTENSADTIWIASRDGMRLNYLSPAFERMFGEDRAGVMADFRRWTALLHPEDRDQAMQAIPRILAGETVVVQYRVIRPADGHVVHLRDTGFPLWDAARRITRVAGVVQDVSDIVRAQEALEEEKERFRTLAEGIPPLVWRADEVGLWTWASPQWRAYTGQDGLDSQGRGWRTAVHPEDRDRVSDAWDDARPHGRLDVEYRVRRAIDGAWRWHQTRSVPVRGGPTAEQPEGCILEWLGTTTDIEDLKRLQGQQQVLVAELQHRTRNLMGVVHAISDKTMARSTDLTDFQDRFSDRLMALARVQGLLSRLDEWDRVTFDELLQSEMAAVDGGGDRIRLDGPGGIALRSSTVQTLALALHELFTNALKYGALAQRQGRLLIGWRLEHAGADGRAWLHVDWRESGVVMPPAGAAPRGGGSGRELIERALPYQLKARTSYVMGPDGVRCTIALPVSERQGIGVRTDG